MFLAELLLFNRWPAKDSDVGESVAPGSAGFQVTINGTGFDLSSNVMWNGSIRNTTPLSSSQVIADITAADLALAGTASVTVTNSSPGFPSDTAYFTISTLHNTPQWTRTDYPMGIQTERQAVADFNGDGILDIVSIDASGNALLMSLGNGNGTFQPAISTPAFNHPANLVVGYFDYDMIPDVVTANYASGTTTSTISLYRSTGTGTFYPRVDTKVGKGPIALGTGDFDCDGWWDLMVVNSIDNTVTAMHNMSSWHFLRYSTLVTNKDPVSIATGDFNNDGNLDLAVANFGNYAGNTVSVFLGTGNLSFLPKVDYVTDGGTQSVIAADFNGDGILDLATANGCGHATYCGRPGTVSVLLGNGNGTFQNAVNYDAGSYPFTVVAGNFRATNALDLAVTDLDSGQLTFLQGAGNGTFPTSVVVPTNARPVGLAAGDFNNDGKLDLAVGGTSPSGLTVMLQK
jgi:VCBS repeat protein